TASFKMGSPVKPVGIVHADVSTCVAGWLGRKPDMLPMRVKVNREPEGSSKTFNVEMVRLRPMQGVLAFTVLTNSIDMEGDLPDEMTAEMKVRIEVEGQDRKSTSLNSSHEWISYAVFCSIKKKITR